MQDSEKLLLEADITSLEMMVPKFEALLLQVERLKWRLVLTHTTIVRLVEARDVHINNSDRVETGLEEALTMLTGGEKWLQHIRDSHQQRLTLSKAVHGGEVASIDAWRARKVFHEQVVVLCLAALEVSLQAVDEICDEIIDIMEEP